MELAYLVPVAGLCLLGGSLFLLRSRTDGGPHPVVRGLLEQAMAQRSVMLVEFIDQELASGRFFGSCGEFDEDTVLIDVALRTERSEWIGEAVLVSFRIDHKGASSHYQFTSRLCGLPRGVGGFSMLLEAPAEIMPNQRRSFIRLIPSTGVVFGVAIWSLKDAQPRPDDPASLGAAQCIYRQDHSAQLALLNVSATGMRLEFKRPRDDQASIEPQPGARLICLLMLRSQGGGQPLPLWLECTVKNRAEKENGAHSIVGLNFNAWAVTHGGKDAITWFTVGEGGAVGPLGTWILRQQLVQLTQRKTAETFDGPRRSSPRARKDTP